MIEPERLTILVKDIDKIELVKNKILRILREIPVTEQQYRMYVDTGDRTVIHIVLENVLVERFIYEALNHQITFVATNSKVRRILDMLAIDFEDKMAKDKVGKGRKTSSEDDNDEYFDIKDFDESTYKMGKILSLTEPDDIIDNVEDLQKEGEKIISETTEILRKTVEVEIEKSENVTVKDGQEKFENALKRLKEIMTETILTRKELADLSYKAGLSFFNLLKGNDKYNDDLKELIENENVDDYLRLKAAETLIENMRKQHYRLEEIKQTMNLEVLSALYNKQKENLENNEISQIKALLEF